MTAIIKPYITERSSILSSENVYCFLVAPTATKPQVAEAIKNLYKVKPLAIRMVNKSGKTVTRGAKVGKSASIRKAYVKVPAGTKIEFV